MALKSDRNSGPHWFGSDQDPNKIKNCIRIRVPGQH
jgi:hypothetical protein